LFQSQKRELGMRISLTQFIRSKSGLALAMYLAFAAIVSAGVGYAFHSSTLEKFRTQKAEEKTTALRLVDAFVTAYSYVRSQLGPDAPVPATFRAHSIEGFNKQAGSNGEFLLRWVGRPGREIATPPADPEMAATIEAFAARKDPEPVSTVSTIGGRLVFRTIYPSLAREQSCVDCHNQLQQGMPQWQLNDVMGAFAIDVPVAAFLQGLRSQSYHVALGLFAALAVVGLTISILHFRQTSEREAAASELHTQNMMLDTALRNISQGLCMFDADQRLVIANRRYAEMYGLTREQVKPGTTLRQILGYRVAVGAYTGSAPEDYINERLAAVRGKTTATKIHTLADGRVFAISHSPTADGGWVATHEDITEQRRTEARIAHMALHDGLTDLPNRTLLNERLEHALERVRPGEIVAIHLLDLDLFKNVNDTLGHAVGDKLLKAATGRLRALVREVDTIARMGGDEFAIVQTALAQPTDAAALAERIIEVLGQPYDIDGHHVLIGTSIGIAVGPADGAQADQLTRNADLALYRAKSEGRGTLRFFEPGMDVQMQARRELEHDLRRALPAGEFELHYQPMLNLADNDITGVEALVRWRHPERGMIPPGEFIPLAEETGLILPLGEWAIREACATTVKWPGDVRVAVNLSPVQFRSPGLVQVVVNALATSGLAPQRLELEITEGILLHDSKTTLAMLFALREMGVRIAMDDFGTGYSSLSYLQTFPFDKIKIDRSFVKDITHASGSRNIVRAVAAMAKGLGMQTTAEGVETQAQLDAVKAEGCTEMQGFLLSRALPADEIVKLLEASAARKAETQDAA
jgi:diguanylate cyclase (GGDEF)-like protein